MEGEHDGLLPELPQESWLRIFSFLSPSNSLHVCLTCKLWNELWQDKALWKHLHHSLLGGRPRPPLLPNSWQKSVKATLQELSSLASPKPRFEFAIRQGRTVLVSDMLAKDPSLLTFNTPQAGKANTSIESALQICGEADNNLPMFKLLWSICQSPTNSTKVGRGAIEKCAKQLIRGGDETLLRYLLSVSPEAQVYVKKRSYPNLSRYSLAFVTLLEETGVDFSQSTLSKCLMNVPVALWLMDRANWSRDEKEKQVFWWQERSILRAALWPEEHWKATKEMHVPRCVVKKLLQKGASSNDWGELLEEYAKRLVIDKKVLKWLLKKHEEAQGCKEENLAFYVAALEKGDAKLLQFLIKIGATDVNHVHPGWGKTLLQVAVEKGSKPMAEALLACGADMTIKGKGVPPLTMANQKGFDDLTDLLRAHSKNIELAKKKASKKKKQAGGKRKRQDQGDEDGGEGEKAQAEEKEKEESRKVPECRKRKRSNKKPLSEKRREELRMEARVLELQQWLSQHDDNGERKYDSIEKAKHNGFTSFDLKQVCNALRLLPPAQKKEVLWQTILQFLEERQAVVSHEM